MITAVRAVPVMLWLGLTFIAAETLDYLTYAQAPYLERNVVPMLIAGSVFYTKILCVAVIIAGDAILVIRGRKNAPVLVWAKAVLIVGTGVALASFWLNFITLWRAA